MTQTPAGLGLFHFCIPALPCVRDNVSFAPLGLDRFPLSPRACALGCILTPLRGYNTELLFHRKLSFPVLTQALPCQAFTCRRSAARDEFCPTVPLELRHRLPGDAVPRRSRRQAGAEIVELALVLPLLFLVVFGILWFGMAFNIASTLQRAAKLGVQTAARPTCVIPCGNIFSTNAQIVTSITSVLNAGHLNAANLTANSPPFVCQATPVPSCATLSNVEICTGAPLTCGGATCQTPPVACGANPALGVRVSFGYRFNSPVPLGSWRNITIPASAQSQVEN